MVKLLMTLKSMVSRTWARRFAYLFLALAAAGIASPTDFTHFHVGPLHSLELILLGWFATLILARTGTLLSRQKPLWPAASFFIWGAILFAIDLIYRRDQISDPLTMQRVWQHAVLFVYPVVWMTAGLWLAATDRAITALIILIVLLMNTLPSLLGDIVANLSLGPLTSVVLVVCLDKALSWPVRSAERLAYWFISLGLALVTFFPYWRLWYIDAPMQRTSLMVLLFMLVATPLLRRKKLSSLRTVAITLPVFALGFAIASTGKPAVSIADHVADTIFGSTEKTGMDTSARLTNFSLSTVRKFWWHQAVQDWKQNPMTGVGFIPEVPSLIVRGLPNDWQTVRENPQFHSTSPISGPHNSYLTILARMGIIGFGLFLLIAANWLWTIWPLIRGRELNLYEIMVIMLPVSGAIHALLNIGLETPRSCALLWFFAGAATVYAASIAEAEAAASSRD